jgi:hypothetical protein
VHVFDRALALTRRDEGIVFAWPFQEADPAECLIKVFAAGRRCPTDTAIVEP